MYLCNDHCPTPPEINFEEGSIVYNFLVHLKVPYVHNSRKNTLITWESGAFSYSYRL
jgi:hypothetical protein